MSYEGTDTFLLLVRQRDELLAEVERLTAERDALKAAVVEILEQAPYRNHAGESTCSACSSCDIAREALAKYPAVKP